MDTNTLSMTIVGPPTLAGTVLHVGPGRQLVGRDAGADLHIDDQHVGSRHATIDRFGDRVVVEDLGSSTGTWIGDERLRGACELHGGDVVRFGRVAARLEATGAPLRPADSGPRHPPDGPAAGHDSYVQQRDSLMREVAASRTRARSVFWAGLAIVLVGACGCAYCLAGSTDESAVGPGSGTGRHELPMSGANSGLGPVGTIFVTIGFVGQFLLILGTILWIIASAHVRRVDTDRHYPWNSHPPE